jgi:hypothetical protein
MLEDKIRISAGRLADRIPIDCVMKIDIKICDHRPVIHPHVRGGWDVGLFNVLDLVNQGLLRAAA